MSGTYHVVWAAVAVRDLDEIAEYVARHDSVHRAIHLYTALRDGAISLGVYPLRSRVVPEMKELGVTEYRELIIKPYRVFFRISDKQVVIVGILDGRRKLEQILIDRIMTAGY